MAPDLPGHGRDETPLQQVSLRAYADRVCELLDAQTDPVILVGHSMGGIVISQAAEYRPQKIRVLVYLSAFLVGNGETLLQHGMRDDESLLFPNLVTAPDQSYQTIKDNVIRDIFYADCTAEEAKQAQERLRLQASAPAETPLSLNEDAYGIVPRVYIECLRDRAISPEIQKGMYTAMPCAQVLSLDTGHSPFYAAPAELARILIAVAAQFPNDRAGQ